MKKTLEEKIRTEGNNASVASVLKRVITQLKESQEKVESKVYALLEFAILFDNHGSGYLGMAKGFQCTRQISGYLSRILSPL